MAYKYRWLQQALEDLAQEIGFVQSEFGDHAARKVEAHIHERVSQLCLFPSSGVRYEGLYYKESEVRVLHIRQISIIYCLDDEVITLIAVWNNYQNPDRLLEIVDDRQ